VVGHGIIHDEVEGFHVVRPELCDVAIIASDKVKSREAKASTRRVLSPSRLCLPVRHLSHNNQECIFSQRSDGMALCYVVD
jgi:hypothetical protein